MQDITQDKRRKTYKHPTVSNIKEIETIFNNIYNVMKKKYHKYCYNNIIFNGETNYNNFIKLETNDDKIILSFSNNYINNTETKIKNVLKRYILTTNPDGTFKDYNTLIETINTLKLFELLKTIRYDYLTPRISQTYNCFCLKCFNKYHVDTDITNYQCICGGKLHDNSPIYNDYSQYEFKLKGDKK